MLRSGLMCVAATLLIGCGDADDSATPSSSTGATSEPTPVNVQVETFEAEMFKRRKTQPKADPAVYNDLRSRVLTLDPVTAGLQPTHELPDVWGVLLETGYPEGSSTLVALADGTTSLYLSSGGGVIGGGQHDQVATRAKELVGAAQQDLNAFPSAEDREVPPDGLAVIRVLTYDGPRAIQAPEADFGEGRHPQSDLFHKAHDVITELRLIEEQR